MIKDEFAKKVMNLTHRIHALIKEDFPDNFQEAEPQAVIIRTFALLSGSYIGRLPGDYNDKEALIKDFFNVICDYVKEEEKRIKEKNEYSKFLKKEANNVLSNKKNHYK
jgi:hypothetical protein